VGVFVVTEEERLLGRDILQGICQQVPMPMLRQLVSAAPVRLPKKAMDNRKKLSLHLQRAWGEPLADYITNAMGSGMRLVAQGPEEIRARVDKDGGASFLLIAGWTLQRMGKAEVFEQATAGMDLDEYHKQRQAGIEWGRTYEELEAKRLSEERRARAAASAGLQAAERQAAAAREEAARQIGRTRRTVRRAGELLAAAHRDRRRLQEELASAKAEVDALREILRERDEQARRLVADYEERLAGRKAVNYGRVLVVGDPNRAAGYTAEALAMGASSVEFFDGMTHPNDLLAGLCASADVVVLNLAWCKHVTSEAVGRSRARVARMRVAGLKAFREALEGVGGHVAGDSGRRAALVR